MDIIPFTASEAAKPPTAAVTAHRRNWCVRFYRQPVRIASAAPGPGCPLPCNYNVPRKKRLVFSPHFRYNRKNQVIRYKDREVDFHETQSRRVLVAVLLLVIAVAVAGIVYYVLRITQTGPATATGGVEPTEPSFLLRRADRRSGDGRADRNGGPDGDHFARSWPRRRSWRHDLDEKLCQLFVVTPTH